MPSKSAPSRRPTGRPRGRPQSQEWADNFLPVAEAIAKDVGDGTGLTAACAKFKELTPAIFLRWVELHVEARRAWDRAKQARAARLFEDGLDIAAELKKIGETSKEAGTKRSCLVEAASLIKWAAAKLDPGSYGDKSDGGPKIAIQINTSLPVEGYDPLDDGSGSFTVRVGQSPALEHRNDEDLEALPVKPEADPSTPWEPYAPSEKDA